MLPIVLGLMCLFVIYLAKEVPSKIGIKKGIKARLEKDIVVSKQIKKAILYLIGFVLIYSLFYSVVNSFLLLESTLEGNAIIKPELENVEINEGKAQTLLNVMLVSYITLSTFFAGSFIKSVIKSSIGIMKNRNLNIKKVENQ
ncbi:hypothetical protein [Mammaliicoccus sp. E-M21]|uniref:hypothetical protein n=1 Tax=Mammaliicoccus sp. E-M21 TaxID=2898681 RepID=UPI001EFB93A2|nr:hypothetical protein [Mammaliicoccus sp. E-M21]